MPPIPAPRRRGRPPGHSAPRLMKRIVIAGAVLQGVKIAQVARDLGVSRSWASREAHDPETQRASCTPIGPVPGFPTTLGIYLPDVFSTPKPGMGVCPFSTSRPRNRSTRASSRDFLYELRAPSAPANQLLAADRILETRVHRRNASTHIVIHLLGCNPDGPCSGSPFTAYGVDRIRRRLPCAFIW